MDFESPHFIKYQDAFNKNRQSRVFAPLADLYRKMGMTEKAMQILKDGLTFHPDYLLAYMIYAQCCLDIHKDSLAYETLKPFKNQAKENIQFQRIFGTSAYETGHFDEAILCYKAILFAFPKDEDAQEKLNSLLKMQSSSSLMKSTFVFTEENSFHEEKLNVSPLDANDEDGLHEWVQLEVKSPYEETSLIAPEIDSWNVAQGAIKSDDPVKYEEDQRTFFVAKVDLPKKEKPLKEEKKSASTPFMTHTLVELYLSQGLVDKAKEILTKMVELNPHDFVGLKKIEEIENSLLPDKSESTYAEVEEKYNKFLDLIRKKSKQVHFLK